MNQRRRLSALVLLALLGQMLLGCTPSLPEGPDLEITRWRYNLDEKHEIVRVAGEIVNHSDSTVPEVEIYTTLLSSSGSKCGVNMEVVRDLRPGEKRTFALNVTSRGQTSRVELHYEIPEPD